MALDIITSINLDMKAPNAEKVYASQYDSTGHVNAQLLNDGEKWAVPSGAIGTVLYMKSDRIGGYYDTTEHGESAISFLTASDRSQITIALDQQTMSTSGDVYIQVSFTLNGKRLTTFKFVMEVEASVIVSSNVESKWFVNLLATSGIVIDDTLSIAGNAADAKRVGDKITEEINRATAAETAERNRATAAETAERNRATAAETAEENRARAAENMKVNKPIESPNGISGQLLRTNGDGTTVWVTAGTPTDEQVGEAVSDWLDEHPDATTTVEDGSITYQKLREDLEYDVKISKSRSIDTNDGTNLEYYGQYAIEPVNEKWLFTQGMCIANDKIYQMHIIDPQDNDGTGICNCYIVNLLTGSKTIVPIPYVSHFNDITYDSKLDKILAMNGGTITVLNPVDLTVVATATIPIGYGHYQIAYISGDTIAIGTNAYIAICTIDSNYNITVDKTITIDQEFTAQTMCYYDDHLYLSQYITPNYYDIPPEYEYGVMISIFDLDGNFVKAITIDNTYGEVEGMAVYNDELILSFQRYYDSLRCTQSFLHLPIYKSLNKYTLRNFNDRGLQRNDQEINMYVDSNYTGFFCDGTSEHPFVGLADAVNFANHLNTSGVQLNVAGSFGDARFYMPGVNYYIEADTTNRCSIRRIIGACQYLRIRHCDLGNSTLTASPIYFRSGLLFLSDDTLSCASEYDCINAAYGQLWMGGDVNRFLSGNNGITAAALTIINRVNNIYNVSGMPYNLSGCIVIDHNIPNSYTADEPSIIASTKQITNFTLTKCSEAATSYDSIYQRDHTVFVHLILRFTENISGQGSTLILSGLPKPKKQFEIAVPIGVDSKSLTRSVVLKFSTDGEVFVWYTCDIAANELMYIDTSYLVTL